jgi:hypothetical protein
VLLINDLRRAILAGVAAGDSRYAWAMATSIPNENPGHELDMVTIFSSQNHDAEMEAMALKSLLDANGIDSAVVGSTTIPSVEFQVQVPRSMMEEAEKVMADAQAAGPAAAEEAEAAGEAGGLATE